MVRKEGSRLLRFGGWMTVSNIVGPLMVTLDRFLIGALISVSAVAYYATPYEVVSQHITAAPVPPSVRSGLQIPPALEEVILACLAKEPERRPPDGPELARRLEACALPQQWTERQAQEWWRDHMPAAAGAAWEAGVSGDRSAFASTV